MNKQAKVILKEIQARAKQNRTYYVVTENYYPHVGGPGDSGQIAAKMGCTYELWAEVYKLEKRYQRFCHYVKEVKPAWKHIAYVPFADNSVEEIQENQYGERRQFMVKAPSGDLCY